MRDAWRSTRAELTELNGTGSADPDAARITRTEVIAAKVRVTGALSNDGAGESSGARAVEVPLRVQRAGGVADAIDVERVRADQIKVAVARPMEIRRTVIKTHD